MQTIVLVDSHYLPSLEYFCALLPFEEVRFEANEYFVKQTFRNRCFINTAQGVKMLSVPLLDRHGKILMKEGMIEPGNKWRNNHCRSIETADRKAPYFDYYSGALRKVLYQGHEFLI